MIYRSLVLPPKPSQSGGDGAIEAGAGFGVGFFFFVAGGTVLRLAYLDFLALDFRFVFAMIQPPVGSATTTELSICRCHLSGDLVHCVDTQANGSRNFSDALG